MATAACRHCGSTPRSDVKVFIERMKAGTQVVRVMFESLQHPFDVGVFNSQGDGDLGVRHAESVGDAFIVTSFNDL